MNILGKYYQEGNSVLQVDFEKSATLLYNAFFSEKNLVYKNNFLNLIHNEKVNWRPEFHEHWKNEVGLNQQIVTLLLISKNRFSSFFQFVNIFVKGIALNVIKFLCHLRQSFEKEN